MLSLKLSNPALEDSIRETARLSGLSVQALLENIVFEYFRGLDDMAEYYDTVDNYEGGLECVR